MEIIRCENLSFQYPQMDEWVLHDLSFQIEQSEIALIIGSSGCGKTTLLKHMKKSMIPFGNQKGAIYYQGSRVDSLDDRISAKNIGFVQQNPENQIVTDKVWHELSFGLESLGTPPDQIRKAVAEIAEYFGISGWFHKDTALLSGGQKQLLNLASIMVMQPEILVLDEPTAQLDPIAAQRFLDTVVQINQDFGTTVLMTEHRLETIYTKVDHIIALDHGNIICEGSPTKTAAQIAQKYASFQIGLPAAMRIYAGVLREESIDLNRCPQTVRQARVWLAKITGESEIKKESSLESGENKEELKDHVLTAKPQMRLKEVDFRYQKSGPQILENLSLTVRYGKCTALMGGNGAGKSTLLKLMAGIKKPQSGKIECHGKTVLLPQNPMALFTEVTVEDELAQAMVDPSNLAAKTLTREGKIEKVMKMLDQMELTHLKEMHPFDLSGGQQQKLALGKVLLYEPDILLLDEPTKGLDPQFKETMGKQFREFLKSGMTIVMASHDVEFCAEYADECAFVFDQRIAVQESTKCFFTSNRFYTTQANKIASGILADCVTCEDVIQAALQRRVEL